MAILYRSRPAHQSSGKPMECPECGTQMFSWSAEKYGGEKAECFSMNCAKPFPIGMIRGDVRGFSQKEYSIPGHPYVCYPKADGYSGDLREAVRKHLMAHGFTKIGFIEPNEDDEKSESHTVITGVHISPTVNIAFRKAPKTNRIFVFDNKFGVVALQFRYYDGTYERHYQKWYGMTDAVYNYNKELGLPTIRENEKAIIIPGREHLRQEATENLVSARKNDILSSIRSHVSEIDSLKRKIVWQKEGITKLRQKYEAEFGEPAPAQKGEA